ncbi:chymotrypsin-elastase inhibitor ixodidin-like [Anopheles nili]|uniref:chymotrypsin-elastase inhibitor ixodidin-like n=1 Tax=Anopheles nili TaxID=185578 RepID=UPI00237B1B19|nr:chymotrypsin-elastase inhibitor ixodidin-like [Anopheles nili]
MKLGSGVLPLAGLVSVALFLIICFAGTTTGQLILCDDPNETYDDCGPFCGDRTCSNMRRNDVKCVRSCIDGCFCKGGYVRNKANRCIPAYMCSVSG